MGRSFLLRHAEGGKALLRRGGGPQLNGIDMITPMAVSHRRQFVRAALVTAGSDGRILGANDRIRIGAIGTGQRGQTLLGMLNRLESNDIVALCDVYKPHLATTRAAPAPNAQEYAARVVARCGL